MATTTTARRRDHRGRYVPTFTLRYTHEVPLLGARDVERTARTAADIERMGTLLLRQPEDRLYNIAVLDSKGDDVTFDFTCFQN
jgi:hypothetical protein